MADWGAFSLALSPAKGQIIPVANGITLPLTGLSLIANPVICSLALELGDARNLTKSAQLSGTVLEGVAALGSVMVRLYHRKSGQLINGTRTAADGTFSFTGLVAASEEYFVVAFDPDGGVNYNAVVLDKLTPA